MTATTTTTTTMMMLVPKSPNRRPSPLSYHQCVIAITSFLLGFVMSSFLFLSTQPDHDRVNHPRDPFHLIPWAPSSPSLSQEGSLDDHSRRCSCEETISVPASAAEEWHDIHVFVGENRTKAANHSQPSLLLLQASSINADFAQRTEWFSQSWQDRLVITLLRHKKSGYFVDLAANDGIRISNSYVLETRYQWQGLCIEPNPIYWSSLAHRQCTVLAAVVGRDYMESVRFKFPNRAAPQGGIVGPDFDNKRPSAFHEDRTQFTVPLASILDRFGAPNVIDYLSLDIEGAETYALAPFPFHRYRFNLITIERPDDKLHNILEQNGYRMIKILRKKWGETLWAHHSAEPLLDMSALELDTDSYRYHEQ